MYIIFTKFKLILYHIRYTSIILNILADTMDKNRFNELLVNANLSKKAFSDIFNLSQTTVNGWGGIDKPIPYWVESWLELYIDKQKFKALKSAIKNSGACK